LAHSQTIQAAGHGSELGAVDVVRVNIIQSVRERSDDVPRPADRRSWRYCTRNCELSQGVVVVRLDLDVGAPSRWILPGEKGLEAITDGGGAAMKEDNVLGLDDARTSLEGNVPSGEDLASRSALQEPRARMGPTMSLSWHLMISST
jgi:hypothetical protein